MTPPKTPVRWGSPVNPAHIVKKLAGLGFRFRLDGNEIKVRYEGERTADLHQVRDLLAAVKTRKEEVREFLRCCCPKCGGIVFVGGECFICDWQPQAVHVHHRGARVEDPQGEACGGCSHFIPSRVNPAQGFGLCSLAGLSKRPGAYPGKPACPHFEAAAGHGTLRLAH